MIIGICIGLLVGGGVGLLIGANNAKKVKATAAATEAALEKKIASLEAKIKSRF